jgi:hypothetical protein
MDTHQDLIDICEEIGGISESNIHFTSGLARKIEATGKCVAALTVGELIHLFHKHRDVYNRIHS